MAFGAYLIASRAAAVGGTVTAGSLGGVFVFIRRAWQLGRDQAILELLPNTYETLLGLSQTPEQYEIVFKAMLEETVALRRHLREV
jgi:hypothetical protein